MMIKNIFLGLVMAAFCMPGLMTKAYAGRVIDGKNYKHKRPPLKHKKKVRKVQRARPLSSIGTSIEDTAKSEPPKILQLTVPAIVPPAQPKIEEAKLEIPTAEKPIAETPIKGGNIFVSVKGNDVPSVRLGLAQRGVTVIEFPSDDPVYQIHPGDENFVTVSCTSSDKSGKDTVAVQCTNSPFDAIILRPGTDFFQDSDTSTIITVQRNSGLVVSFIIVPVKTLGQNANHVMMNYRTDEIVQSRKEANLSVNLAGDFKKTSREKDGFTKDNAKPKEAADTDGKENADVKKAEVKPTPATIEELTVAELKTQAEAKTKLKFGKSNYGLALAVLPNQTRVNDRAIDVIAIKNTTNSALRLVPEQPDLFIETVDEKGNISNSQRLPILHIATTLTDGEDILQPGKIYYFAFSYDEPILGIRQSLKVGLAQTNAADAPVKANLNGIVR